MDNYIKRYRPSKYTGMYIEIVQYKGYSENDKKQIDDFLNGYILEAEESGDIISDTICLSIYKNKTKRLDECIKVKPGDYIIKFYNGEIGSCTENIGEFLLDYFNNQWY